MELCKFEELTDLGKSIRNQEHILESHKRALAILIAGKSDFIPQLTMQAAIDKEQAWLYTLRQESDKEQGACNTYSRCTRCSAIACSKRAFPEAGRAVRAPKHGDE